MSRNNGVVLNLPYAGCVWHWAQMLAAEKVVFEACGAYQRRTSRTRTSIVSASGALDISVPVERDSALRYKEIRINRNTDWATQHFRALMAAYNSTPFFEFFADDFAALYNRRHDYIWDLNVDMMHLVADLMGVELEYDFTSDFVPAPDGYSDLRIAIEPKYQHLLSRSDSGQQVVAEPYYQVFQQRLGFVPGASVLDVLFNLGPESRLIIRQMAKQLKQ